MTIIRTHERKPSFSNEAKSLFPEYNLSDRESSLNKNQSYTDRENQKGLRPRSKYLLLQALVAVLLLCWGGFRALTSEWGLAITKELIGTSFMSDCHAQSDSDEVNVMNLPSKYLPTVGPNRQPRRLVMIGDVHGMYKSLENLLKKVEYNITRDHLIFVGDLVAKGPDSAEVVDLAMRLNATCVRGNHEDQVIQAWDDMQAENDVLNGDELKAFSSKPYDKKHKILAQALGRERIEWIKKWPIILRIGKLGCMGEVLVVHAGLDVEASLKKQDLHMVMNMRSKIHGVLSDKHGGHVWTKDWNKHQRTIHKDKRRTIVYGHDAKRGLRVKSYTLGIDSACFKGNKLTAAIIEGDDHTFSYDLVQVKC